MLSDKFIPVDTWHMKPEDSIIKYDGRLVIFPFDKVFNNPKLEILNTFMILKESYVNQLPSITHYINYFIKFYDEDNELSMAYLKLKSIVDNKENHISLHAYISILYNVLFSESMQKKIIQLTEDNYYIDISSNDGKQYNESLEFTEKHAKVLMCISMSMKLMIPPMFHYINKIREQRQKAKTKSKKHVKAFSYKDYMPRFYEELFDMYGKDVDIYNKLWISTWARLNVHHSANKVIWEQRAIYGVTPITHMHELLKDKIVCETIFRYVFCQNIVSFNHVIIKNQLGYFICDKYKYNRIELTNKKDADGLSGLDKLEMSSIKVDESIGILSKVNIKKTIKRIEKQMHTKIDKDELDFYFNNMRISKFQVQLCQYFYARIFGGFRDLSLLSKKKYLKILLLLKKRLQLQGLIYLPAILTANIEGRLNARTIRNDKFLSKIESSSMYQSIMTNKYDTLKEIGKDDTILNTLSVLINTKFTFCEYDFPEKCGQIIDVNPDIVSDEYLSFINQL